MFRGVQIAVERVKRALGVKRTLQGTPHRSSTPLTPTLLATHNSNPLEPYFDTDHRPRTIVFSDLTHLGGGARCVSDTPFCIITTP